jgi:hypothetical protein
MECFMNSGITLTETLALPFLSPSPSEDRESGDPVAEETTIYRIPEDNFRSLQARFNKLQHRAVKLESGEISMTEIGHVL